MPGEKFSFRFLRNRRGGVISKTFASTCEPEKAIFSSPLPSLVLCLGLFFALRCKRSWLCCCCPSLPGLVASWELQNRSPKPLEHLTEPQARRGAWFRVVGSIPRGSRAESHQPIHLFPPLQETRPKIFSSLQGKFNLFHFFSGPAGHSVKRRLLQKSLAARSPSPLRSEHQGVPLESTGRGNTPSGAPSFKIISPYKATM